MLAQLDSHSLSLLYQTLAQPTAPFREHWVRQTLAAALEKSGVPYFQDAIGNLVVGVAHLRDYQRVLNVKKQSKAPLPFFIAHMDHPGFHGVEWKSKKELQVEWHGGSPTQHLEGASVWVADSSGRIAEGILKQPQLIPSGRALASGVVEFSEPVSVPAPQLFGGFKFRAPVWTEGSRLYTHAADDLVGCFAIVTLAQEWFAKRDRRKTAEPPFLGLLTRGEEVGFIGAIGHFRLPSFQKARRRLISVSLETSRQLPGAEIGKGPIVRLGDRLGPFSPGPTRVLSQIAQERLPQFHQRRIMDGGACEASAALSFGLETIALSVPLGNYHNQGLEGGPDCRGDNGPAPEFVDLNDVAGLLELCRGIVASTRPPAANLWSDPWKSQRQELERGFQKYRPHLKA